MNEAQMDAIRQHLPSEDRVHIVQEVYGAFVRGDIAAVLAALSPDVEWGEPDNPWNPAAGTRHGHAGFLEWARIGRAAEEILCLEPREFLTGSDSVAVVGFSRCRAKLTGRIYATEFVHLIRFDADKIVRFREFFDTYAAAEAFRSTQ
jgi:ketosteroid isomerase-like protein